LIWHQWDWIGAGLLNIPDYQTVTILTKFLTGNFCYFAASHWKMCNY